MYLKRWDDFRERRTEAMRKYISVIKVKKMVQFFIVKQKLNEILLSIWPHINIIKKKNRIAYTIALCVIRMKMNLKKTLTKWSENREVAMFNVHKMYIRNSLSFYTNIQMAIKKSFMQEQKY